MLFVPEELRQSPAAKALHKQYAGAKGYFAALRRDRRRLRVHLMIGGIALVALVAAVAWLMSGRYASTDNAYVRAPGPRLDAQDHAELAIMLDEIADLLGGISPQASAAT